VGSYAPLVKWKISNRHREVELSRIAVEEATPLLTLITDHRIGAIKVFI